MELPISFATTGSPCELVRTVQSRNSGESGRPVKSGAGVAAENVTLPFAVVRLNLSISGRWGRSYLCRAWKELRSSTRYVPDRYGGPPRREGSFSPHAEVAVRESLCVRDTT